MPLNEAGNPARCNCCWDCGDCMPLIYSSPGCPEIASATSCITTPLESWATPTYTEKKRPGESTGIYATTPGINITCDCTWQLYQYCINDAAGTNGRSWVVEGDCHDNVANTTTHFGPTIVRDWNCLCVGARYEFMLTVGGCCCGCGAPGCDCTPPTDLYVDTTGCWPASAIHLTDSGGGCWDSVDAPPLTTEINSVRLCCTGGEWILTLFPVNAGCFDYPIMTATGGTCSPFDLTFPDFTLDSTCCPAAGGTVSATVSE